MAKLRRNVQDDVDRRMDQLLDELTADDPSLRDAIEFRARFEGLYVDRTVDATKAALLSESPVIVSEDADELTTDPQSIIFGHHLRPIQFLEIVTQRHPNADEGEHLAKCDRCRAWLPKYHAVLYPTASAIATHEGPFVWERRAVFALRVHRLRDGLRDKVTHRLDGAKAALASLRAPLPAEVASGLELQLSGIRDIASGLHWTGNLFEPIARQKIGPTNGNRILEAAIAWATEAAHAAGQHADRQLRDQLGKIEEKYRASSASIWLIEERPDPKNPGQTARFVVPFITSNNHRSKATRKNGYHVSDKPEPKCGLITLAAMGTGKVIEVADVDKDPLFTPFFRDGVKGTRSEITIPLFVNELGRNDQDVDNRQPVGVLDLQFDEIRSNDDANEGRTRSADNVLRDALSLIPDIVVIDQLRRGEDDWCPWHPDTFRNGAKLLERLCHDICDALGSDSASMTVWIADHLTRTLSAFATARFDYEYCGEKSLPIYTILRGDGREIEQMSWTGDVLTSPDAFVREDNPSGVFREYQKAKSMQLRVAYGAPIPRVKLDGHVTEAPSGENQILQSAQQRVDAALTSRIGTLNLYFKGDGGIEQTNRRVVELALPTLARFIGGWMAAYDNLRQRFAWNLVQLVADSPPEQPNSSRTRLWRVRRLVSELFGGDIAVSFFGRFGNVLLCTSTDGLYRPQTPSKSVGPSFTPCLHWDPPFDQDGWGPLCYEMSDAAIGLTVDIASSAPANGFRTTRRKLDDQARDSSQTKARNPSKRLREHFGVTGDYQRWFLGAAVPNQQRDRALGVIRLIRQAGERPFTESDERLLEAVARSCSLLFEDWRYTEMVNYLKAKQTEYGSDDEVKWLKLQLGDEPLSKRTKPDDSNERETSTTPAVVMSIKRLDGQNASDEPLEQELSLPGPVCQFDILHRLHRVRRGEIDQGYTPNAPSRALSPSLSVQPTLTDKSGSRVDD